VTAEVVPIHRYRVNVPQEHRGSLDTRLLWLWHQRYGTVQTVYTQSEDILDVTAATLILQAIMAKDLSSIQQLFTRLEGAAIFDQDLQEKGAVPPRI
jgi:hypothetical protein